jgi:hypothetical protein
MERCVYPDTTLTLTMVKRDHPIMCMCPVTGIFIRATPEYLEAVLPGGGAEQKIFPHVDDLFTLPVCGLRKLAIEFLMDVAADFIDPNS